jgi:hypothetical protein
MAASAGPSWTWAAWSGTSAEGPLAGLHGSPAEDGPSGLDSPPALPDENTDPWLP